jgi:hypothetical protein
MAEYALTCSCGCVALRPTLGQAAAELLRHGEQNDVDQHAITIARASSSLLPGASRREPDDRHAGPRLAHGVRWASSSPVRGWDLPAVMASP